jgi:hypothetical protein
LKAAENACSTVVLQKTDAAAHARRASSAKNYNPLWIPRRGMKGQRLDAVVVLELCLVSENPDVPDSLGPFSTSVIRLAGPPTQTTGLIGFVLTVIVRKVDSRDLAASARCNECVDCNGIATKWLEAQAHLARPVDATQKAAQVRG